MFLRLIMKKIKYIQRLDFNYTHGWQVRLCYKSSRITHSKMFSDGVYGGKLKALREAKKWRDDLLKRLNLESYLSNPYRPQGPHRRNSKNRSGVIGVHFDCTTRKGNIYYCWIASYQKDKKQTHTHFSINLYGDCGAFKMACKKRFEMSGPLKVYRDSDLPCRIPVQHHYID